MAQTIGRPLQETGGLAHTCKLAPYLLLNVAFTCTRARAREASRAFARKLATWCIIPLVRAKRKHPVRVALKPRILELRSAVSVEP